MAIGPASKKSKYYRRFAGYMAKPVLEAKIPERVRPLLAPLIQKLPLPLSADSTEPCLQEYEHSATKSKEVPPWFLYLKAPDGHATRLRRRHSNKNLSDKRFLQRNEASSRLVNNYIKTHASSRKIVRPSKPRKRGVFSAKYSTHSLLSLDKSADNITMPGGVEPLANMNESVADISLGPPDRIDDTARVGHGDISTPGVVPPPPKRHIDDIVKEVEASMRARKEAGKKIDELDEIRVIQFRKLAELHRTIMARCGDQKKGEIEGEDDGDAVERGRPRKRRPATVRREHSARVKRRVARANQESNSKRKRDPSIEEDRMVQEDGRAKKGREAVEEIMRNYEIEKAKRAAERRKVWPGVIEEPKQVVRKRFVPDEEESAKWKKEREHVLRSHAQQAEGHEAETRVVEVQEGMESAPVIMDDEWPGIEIPLEADRPIRSPTAEQVIMYFSHYDKFWVALHSLTVTRALIFSDFPWPVLRNVEKPTHITPELIREFVFHPLFPGRQHLTKRDRIQVELRRWQPEKFTKMVTGKLCRDHVASIREAVHFIAGVLNTLLIDETSAD
ncbi:hypothetical protein AX16_002307 [Volvariella volvacea WC 439]|nr:hypothetical protein AX16_002307 [Volvariella volvacea WC 439]